MNVWFTIAGFRWLMGNNIENNGGGREIDTQDHLTYTLSLEPGTYYIALKARNAYGDSGFSEEVGPRTIDPVEDRRQANDGSKVFSLSETGQTADGGTYTKTVTYPPAPPATP